MRTQNYKVRKNWKASASWKVQAVAAGLLLMVASVAGCSNGSAANNVAPAAQLTFAGPAEAGQALKTAVQAGDASALQQILGTSSKSIFDLADPLANKEDREVFVTKYDQMNRWVLMTDGSEVLHIGADNFPFPVPIERGTNAKWRFNSEAGEQEVLARRIGANELLAIDACEAISNAEDLYAKKPHDDGATPAYATRIISSPGKRDGLYWQVPEGHKASPLGRVESFAPSVIALAAADGPVVIDGYSYRILTAQGADASGGARNYMVNGKLTGGYAVLASPVKYGETGIMTFLLGPDGFFEQNLGDATSEYASTASEFNPTDDWSPLE
jgi:Protein of unknown function (DUF2950)